MRLAPPGERGPHWRASRTPDGPVTLAVGRATRPVRCEPRRGVRGRCGRSTSCPTCSAPRTTGPGSRRATRSSPRRGAAIPMSASAGPRGRSRRWCRRSSSRRSPARRRSPASARSCSSTASPRPVRARPSDSASSPMPRTLGEHPVVGVARPAHRPGAFAGRRHRGAARRCPRADRQSAPRSPAADLDRAIRSLPGLGVWTSAETRQRALGDPRRRFLRRLPRSQGRRLGVERTGDRRPRAVGGARALAPAPGPGPVAPGGRSDPASKAWSPSVASWTLAPRVTFSRDICYTEQQAFEASAPELRRTAS